MEQPTSGYQSSVSAAVFPLGSRKERAVLAHGPSPSLQRNHERRSVSSLVTQHPQAGGREVKAILTHFLLFIEFRTSALGTGLSTVKVALPPY